MISGAVTFVFTLRLAIGAPEVDGVAYVLAWSVLHPSGLADERKSATCKRPKFRRPQCLRRHQLPEVDEVNLKLIRTDDLCPHLVWRFVVSIAYDELHLNRFPGMLNPKPCGARKTCGM